MSQPRFTARFHHEPLFTFNSDLVECRVHGPSLSMQTVRMPSPELLQQIENSMIHRVNHHLLDEFDCVANQIRNELRETVAPLGPDAYDVYQKIVEMISRLRATVPQVEIEERSVVRTEGYAQ